MSINQTLPSGMRLSTYCPTQAIREFLEPETYSIQIQAEAATLGHLIEQWVIDEHLQHANGQPQFPIAWKWGISHDDYYYHEGNIHYLNEVKSTGQNTGNPKKEWITQLQRRMIQHSLNTGGEVCIGHLHVVSKPSSWDEEITRHPPLRVEINAEVVDSYGDMIRGIDSFIEEYNDADEPLKLDDHPMLKSLCEQYGCGRCVKQWWQVDNPDIERQLQLHAQGHDVKDELRRLLDDGGRYKASSVPFKVSKGMPTPKTTIRWDAAVLAGIIPPAMYMKLYEQLNTSGYVQTHDAPGRLTISPIKDSSA